MQNSRSAAFHVFRVSRAQRLILHQRSDFKILDVILSQETSCFSKFRHFQNFVPQLNSSKTNFLRPLADPGVFSIESCAIFNAQQQNASVGSRAIKIFDHFHGSNFCSLNLLIFRSTITLSMLVPHTSRLAYVNPYYVPVVGDSFIC